MPPRLFWPVLLVLFSVLSACKGQAADSEPATNPGPPTPAEARTTEPTELSQFPRIIFLGDSLTAGLGLDARLSFPSVIRRRLEEEGYRYAVVNAGVSGDTSAGGLRRLDWALSEGDSKILIVALGGNDGLRGLPPEQLESNLDAIVERGHKRGLTVILAGMEAPPNFGADYTARFRRVYTTVADRHKVRLIPFLLDGVAGNPALNQSDGIHPNPRGAEIVADHVWRALQPVLVRATAATPR